MNRLFLLVLHTTPYWVFIGPSAGGPHLTFASLRPIAYALLGLAVLSVAGWWVFRVEDADERLEWLGRVGLGCFVGIPLVYALGFAMQRPGLVIAWLGPVSGTVMGALGLGDALKHAVALPLWVCIVGYTLGVGLPEELSKAVAARAEPSDALYARAAAGFAAGLGFGLGEAILYAYRDYAGVSDWTIYVVRYAFCVGFHGAMSALVVLCLPDEPWERDNWGRTLLCVLPVALLHGTYNALLDRGHPALAGLVAVLLFLALAAWAWWQEEIRGEA